MYKKLAELIISAQITIIGPLAKDISNKVDGLDNPSKETLGKLVSQYESIFGQASVETCKDAIKSLVLENNDLELPDILR